MCRDAQVSCLIFLSVPPKLKMPKKVWKNSHIFVILVSFLHLDVPPIFISKFVCRRLKKVENHCSKRHMKNIVLLQNLMFHPFPKHYSCNNSGQVISIFFWSWIFFAFIKMDGTKWAGGDSCSALMEAPFLNNDAITYPLSPIILSLFIPFNSVCLFAITLSLWFYKFILNVFNYIFIFIFY